MAVLVIVLLGATLLGVVVMLAAFARWRSRTRRRLLRASDIVQTERGPIDCAFAGPEDGPAVLVLHGGLGGWDQGMSLAEDVGFQTTCRVIAPSRPGYLRTPLSVGQTTDEAADAMIGLLDALKTPRAFVVGLSGGGPTALSIAMRHPERVRGLIMICAISHHHVQPGITTESFFGRMLFSNAGSWLLDLGSWLALCATRLAPGFMTRRVLAMTELSSRSEIRSRVRELGKDPKRARWLLRLLERSFPISPRHVGLNNDLAQFASLKDGVDGRIMCPTLVIHGRIDGNVPVKHAESVIAAAGERAETLIIEDASHLLWLHPRCDEIRERIDAFVRKA